MFYILYSIFFLYLNLLKEEKVKFRVDGTVIQRSVPEYFIYNIIKR